MDKTNIGYRLKKYFFFISIVFIILTTVHLFYSYLYSDSKETAIKWWSISEWLIGKVPSLNPLKNKTIEDKYVNNILYRSLLKYNINKKKIVWDIAECDTKNLLKIKCILNSNSKWSNWEDIIKEDIIQTYKILKESKVNPEMYRLLKNVDIEKTEEWIIFNNKTKNIQFLKIFFQPIVSHKVLNLISKKELEWSFQLNNWIYSWKYIVKNVISDENNHFTTIVLVKNKQYFKNEVFIDTIFLKIFPDLETFSKNKDSINLFNDTNNLIWDKISRFNSNRYILPQYANLFTNIDRLKNNKIRKFILDEINKDELIKKIWGKNINLKKIENPFMSNAYIKKSDFKINIKNELSKEWYFTKNELIKKYSTRLKIEQIKITSNISGEVNIKKISWEIKKINKKILDFKYKEVKIINKKSKIIYYPNWVDKYNFVGKNDYTFKWKTFINTTEVFINDYKLKSFKAHWKSFTYRISKDIWNFKKWQNTYKIYFKINWEKKLIEEINFYYDSNKNIRKEKEKEILNWTIKVKIENKKIDLQTKIKWEKLSTDNLEKIKKELDKVKSKLSKINLLDEKYYYNNELKRYSLELYFTSWKIYYNKTAEYIKEKLDKKWIFVELRKIKATELNQLLSKWKDNYDLLLVWMHLSYFESDISTYYHSKVYSTKEKKWVENPYNLSNYKWLDIEIPLEELREGASKDNIKLLEKKVLSVIYDNNLSKTLYSPYLYNLVDKNIKGYKIDKKIPEDMYRFKNLEKSYIKKEKTLNMDNKNTLEYIKFLFSTLIN